MAQKELDITNPPDYQTMMKNIMAYRKWLKANDPTLSALMATPEIDPDTGKVIPNKPQNAGAPSPNAQGKAQSKNAYNGDKMGLSNQTRSEQKIALQAVRDAHPLLGKLKEKSTHPKGEHRMGKKLHHGLRARTKDTVAFETGSASSMGAMMRGKGLPVDEKTMLAENELMKLSEFHKYLGTREMEVAPPGWEPSVKSMKKHPEIKNPYPLAWWMAGQGFKPGGSKK